MIRSIPSIILAICLAAAGCKTPNPTDWAKSLWGEEQPKIQASKYPTPVRVAALWSPAILNQAGKTPTRGFGGRLYFYDAQNKTVPVEGQLVVYAYNDTTNPGGSKTPERKFAFTPEQFTTHFSETELGASYSIWIPWDEAGKPQADISLVPVFTATSGQLVVGHPSRNLLPGTNTPENRPQMESFPLPPPMQQRLAAPLNPLATPVPSAGVQQVAYQEPVAALPAVTAEPAPVASVQTTSINLPGTLADRLAKAAPQESLRRPTSSFGRPGAMPSVAPQPIATSSATAGGAPLAPPGQPTARFVRPRLPVPAGPLLPPAGGPPPYSPAPGALPSALPSAR
ncbi:MAG: hypothetical protein SFU86_13150 [Pirellulaceae bacterium]|nr:hypothetical protein [Pirellulaceae bacterium]